MKKPPSLVEWVVTNNPVALKRHAYLSTEVIIMNRTASIFTQILGLVNRNSFEKIVWKHKAEKGMKGFTCWTQFVSMLFCQMGAAHSLREITGGLATAMGKLKHLGLNKAPARSTLSYANEHRPWQVFESVFYELLGQCQTIAKQNSRKFRFKNPLRSLDMTVIDLCLKTFDWAHFRRAKGAVKLHLQLDHRGYLPCWASVTAGDRHEVKEAQKLTFQPGTIVAMDMGYIDYKMLYRWDQEGVKFVTRAKKNSAYHVLKRRRDNENKNILRDQSIKMTGPLTRKKYPDPLRRIVVWDEKNSREIILLTNIHDFAPSTISTIYKERWQIELFFKAIKQNMKIKTFVGTSQNAVKIQIWTALISILLLKFLKLKSTYEWSLSNLAAMLRFNLLTYRDLWEWIDAPFHVPIQEPSEPLYEQLFLFN